MLVREKTHRIKVRVTGEGEGVVLEAIREKYPHIEIEDEKPSEDSISINEFEPYKTTEIEPGYVLATYRGLRKLTQARLATKTGILVQHLSNMETGTRTISKESAKKLGAALECDYRLFL